VRGYEIEKRILIRIINRIYDRCRAGYNRREQASVHPDLSKSPQEKELANSCQR